MAAKLEKLRVTSVDFVDRGANPDAHVMLFKRDSSGDPPKEGSAPAAGGDLPGKKPEAAIKKGGPHMDPTKMTPEDKAMYETLMKKYDEPGGNGANDPAPAPAPAPDPAPALEPAPAAGVEKAAPSENEEVLKSIRQEIDKELQRMKQMNDNMEMRQYGEIAKKYEILGRKSEELAPILKSAKDAGGTLYDEMIHALDASLEAIKKSGTFDEIGKSGSYYGQGGADEAWARIEKKADELQAANGNLSRCEAIDMACRQNPTLVHEYENAR